MRGPHLLYEKILPIIHNRSPKVLSGKYLIIGAGGVGTWTALLLALSSSPTDSAITIVDDDVLEPVNANRLPYPLGWFFRKNMPKVEALRMLLQFLRPGMEVNTIAKKVEKADSFWVNLARKHDVIIDAVDNLESIQLAWELGKRAKKPVLSLHYDGLHGDLMWLPFHRENFEEPPPVWGDTEQRGYTAPSWAATPAALAAAAIYVISEKPDEYIHIDF